MIERPSVLYKKLFSSPTDRQQLDYLLDSGQSALTAFGNRPGDSGNVSANGINESLMSISVGET